MRQQKSSTHLVQMNSLKSATSEIKVKRRLKYKSTCYIEQEQKGPDYGYIYL